MNKKKKGLHLRKSVIISIPVALVIAVLLGIFMTTNNQSSKKVSLTDLKSNNQEVIENNFSLSENEYLKRFNKYIENRKKDNTIIYYASKFHINVDKALEIAHNITNNYEDEYYITSKAISPVHLRESIGSFNSEEAGIVYFVRNLYSYPQRYGSTIEEIRLNTPTDISREARDKTFYLDNGYNYEQYLGHICDLFGLDKEIVLAISYLETGNLTSGLFTYSNNVGGQRGYDGWIKFPTLEAGIIGHVLSVRGIVKAYQIDLSNPSSIYDLSSIYVNGHLNDPSESWVMKVNNVKQRFIGKDLFTVE